MLSSKRFVQCHLDTSRRSSVFPCSCVWMTAITFLKARLHDTQIRSRTFSDSQLNKFLCFQTFRIDTHQNITQATALLALKAEITAKCMASEGSNCSFSATAPSHHSKGVKARPLSQPWLQSGQLHSFTERISQKLAHATLCPPNRTLACEAVVKFWNDSMKLPALFL